MNERTVKPFWKRPLGITLIVLAVIVILGPILNALGFGDTTEANTDIIATDSETEPEETQEPTPATTEETDTVAEEDITDWVKGLRTDKAELIESATREDSGEIRVRTNIVDPRVQGISPEGTDALAICIAIADQGEDRVWIYEADGTTFVYMRDGICTEA
ncbi:hypothetical protein EJ997_10205 [Flaviflexus ciconiae]|uniref:Uncharacterized protein n=1 Tax=Flaviflexus ciconiae TaxID=2496867 RepID=A0A3Q9G8Q8_9ACTO|nr:hypothetical protein [Flaviflexus ciconiae]AZQ77655.1 hypothetical protein EJ997_10205 [Flaviflexus ciconiae]